MYRNPLSPNIIYNEYGNIHQNVCGARLKYQNLSLRHSTIQGKTNDFSTFAPTYMALVEIMLREISEAEKDNYHMDYLIYGT